MRRKKSSSKKAKKKRQFRRSIHKTGDKWKFHDSVVRAYPGNYQIDSYEKKRSAKTNMRGRHKDKNTYKALPPGKRITDKGTVYYEYRKNRSDLKDDI